MIEAKPEFHDSTEPLLTPSDVASQDNVSVKTVLRWIKRSPRQLTKRRYALVLWQRDASLQSIDGDTDHCGVRALKGSSSA